MKSKIKKKHFIIVSVIAVIVALVSLCAFSFFGDKSKENIKQLQLESGYPSSENTREVVIEDTNFLGAETFIQVKENDNVIVKNCSFEGSINSAIVVTGGTLTLIDSKIFDCQNKIGNGGAVFNSGGIVNIEGNTTIEKCSANNGGAIYVSAGGSLIVDGAIISNNTATNSGGAIYLDQQSSFLMNDGNISQCSASLYGGGIFGTKDINFSMNGGRIVECNAYKRGGALYTGGTVNIDGAHIGEKGLGNFASERGGGAYFDSATVNITGESLVVCNYTTLGTTSSAGGGIVLSSSEINIGTKEKEFSGVIAENEAFKQGGAFFLGSSVVNLNSGVIGATTFNGVEFGPNKAEQGGAAFLHQAGACFVINGGEVVGNTAEVGNGISSTGGAFYLNGGASVEMISGKMSFNHADRGGAIHVGSNSTFVMNGGEICENTAINSAGINSQGIVRISGGALISKNICTNGTKGGGICNEGGVLEIDSATISFNVAVHGGGIYNTGTATIKNANIVENSVSQNGGGIHNNTGTATIKNTKIFDNSSSLYGGGIHNSGTIVMQNISINENTSTLDGGGIYSASSGSLTFEESSIKSDISNNTARNGGGIGNAGTVIIKNTKISENSVSGKGGGIYNLTLGNMTFEEFSTKSEISDNAAMYGGGIYSEKGFLMQDLKIYENSAQSGAGIYLIESVSNAENAMTIAQSVEISSNTAEINGGGLFYSSKRTLNTNGVFSFNTAKNAGGAFFADAKCMVLNFEYCDINQNIALWGGGIYFKAQESENVPQLNIALVEHEEGAGDFKCNISSNTAAYCGAGIYIENVALKLNDAGIYFNYIQYHEIAGSQEEYNAENNRGMGTGIYASGKSASIENLSLTYIADNRSLSRNSTAYGAGIYASGIKFLTFAGILGGNYLLSDNSQTFGGGIFIKNSLLNIESTAIIDGNKASYGGGVSAEGSTINMSGGRISNNEAVGGSGFYVKSKTNVTISSGEISNNIGSAVFAQHGTFIIKGDTEISNNQGNGVYLQQTQFYLQENAKIEGNSAQFGAGIYASMAATVLNLEGGVIQNNKAIDYGAGVMLQSGTINLSGTKITNNQVYVSIEDYELCNKSSAGRGAGIAMNGGVLNMTGGSISNNTSGGLLDPNHEFYKTTGNTVIGEPYGGGIYVNNGAVVNMSGGSISGNISSPNHEKSAGGNVFVTHESDFNMTGGSVSGDGETVQARIGGGIFNMGETIISGSAYLWNCVAIVGGGIASCGGTEYMGSGYPVSLTLHNTAIVSCDAEYASSLFTANDITINYGGEAFSYFDVVMSATGATGGYSDIFPTLNIVGTSIQSDLVVSYCSGAFVLDDVGDVVSYEVVNSSSDFVFSRYLYNQKQSYYESIIFSDSPLFDCEKIVVNGAKLGCKLDNYGCYLILVDQEMQLSEIKLRKITNHGHEEYIDFPGKFIDFGDVWFDDSLKDLYFCVGEYYITIDRSFDEENLLFHDYSNFDYAYSEQNGVVIYDVNYLGYRVELNIRNVGNTISYITPISITDDTGHSGWLLSVDVVYLPYTLLVINVEIPADEYWNDDNLVYIRTEWLRVYINDEEILNCGNYTSSVIYKNIEIVIDKDTLIEFECEGVETDIDVLN